VDQEASWCQEAMSRVLNLNGKMIRIYATSKKRGNSDIKERRNAVRKGK
jgi:hypothetical protein